jgi:hypothetical protein
MVPVVLHSRVMHRCWNLSSIEKLVSHNWNLDRQFRNHSGRLGGSLSQRSFSGAKEDEDKSSVNHVILYERNPQAIIAPRFGLAVAYCHTLYWVWYTLDFVPTVNASPIIEFHVNPMLGKVCCVVALAINIAGAVFVPQQVSKITYSKAPRDDSPVHVYYHTLPFMVASTRPIKYGLGEVALNTTSDQVNQLVDVLQNHQETSQQQQQQPFKPVHIHLKSVNLLFGVFPLPIGLYMTRLDDIKNPVMFLNVLLFANAPQTKPIRNKKHTTSETLRQGAASTRKQPTSKSKRRI